MTDCSETFTPLEIIPQPDASSSLIVDFNKECIFDNIECFDNSKIKIKKFKLTDPEVPDIIYLKINFGRLNFSCPIEKCEQTTAIQKIITFVKDFNNSPRDMMKFFMTSFENSKFTMSDLEWTEDWKEETINAIDKLEYYFILCKEILDFFDKTTPPSERYKKIEKYLTKDKILSLNPQEDKLFFIYQV